MNYLLCRMGTGSERSAQRSQSFWWPYSAVSMSTTCRAGQTAYHPRSPTNEKIGLVCMPDQLHTFYCHWPMRRPGHTCHARPVAYHLLPQTNEKTGPACHAGPIEYHLLSPTNEKTELFVLMPCRTNCIPSTVNDQWELDMYVQYRFMPRRASCNRFTVNDQWEGCAKPITRRYRPMRRMQSYLSICCAQPTACYLSQPMRRHAVPPTISTNETQVKSTKPYGKKCVKDTEIC